VNDKKTPFQITYFLTGLWAVT